MLLHADVSSMSDSYDVSEHLSAQWIFGGAVERWLLNYDHGAAAAGANPAA
jgi:hypothetical protein